MHAVATTPAGSMELIRSCFSTVVGLPLTRDRSAPALPVSGPAQRSLRYGLPARRVAIATLYIEGFSSFVSATAASIATGWSEPVPGRDLHPLKTTTFPQRTRVVGDSEVGRNYDSSSATWTYSRIIGN